MSEKTYFFYSAKQEASVQESRAWDGVITYRPNYARLDDGRVVLFTEQGKSPTPFSQWDDIEHLGTGVYLGHSPTKTAICELPHLFAPTSRRITWSERGPLCRGCV